MSTILINATQKEELRVAYVQDRTLYDLDIERPGKEQKVANIYKGKITRIEKSLGAAFVDYGAARHGFLPFKEVAREYYSSHASEEGSRVNIGDVLREGQEIMVQVEKEERGSKGAALSTFISLAGCYLVLMPNNPRAGGISRRIEGDERTELRDILNALTIPDDMGVIIRTAGVGKNIEELQWDLDVLIKLWDAIKTAYHEDREIPFLIHQESDIVVRAVRDYLRKEVEEILIDDPNIFRRTQAHINRVRPEFTSHVKLFDEKIPLFTYYQIEPQIETVFQREVRLRSGGAIVIDQTEALISIDINSARATSGLDIEETALQTNIEAAEEIARQLRLRDLGGLIAIDFIDMTPIKHQREVEAKLQEAMHMDRARVQIGRISRFGILEMSRQRLRPSLREATQIPCPRCHGQGTIRGIEALAVSILRLMTAETLKDSRISELRVQLPLEVATFILNEKRNAVSDIEKEHNIRALIIPNINLDTPKYKIDAIRGTQGKSQASHSFIAKPAEPEISPELTEPQAIQMEPAVKHIAAARPTRKQKTILKRLIEWAFGHQKRVKKSRHHNNKTQTHQRGKQQQNKRRSPHQQRQRPGNRQRSRQRRYHGKNRDYNSSPRKEKTYHPKNKQSDQRYKKDPYESSKNDNNTSITSDERNDGDNT